MMWSCLAVVPISNGDFVFSTRQSQLSSSTSIHSSPAFKLDSRREWQISRFPRGTRNQAINVVLANSSVPSNKGKSGKVVVMVDPVEAKRLAAKQMEIIKAKEKFIKRRQIEAINGAWAMIGLTAGLVIEGQTGNGILAQLTGYWAAIIGLFPR